MKNLDITCSHSLQFCEEANGYLAMHDVRQLRAKLLKKDKSGRNNYLSHIAFKGMIFFYNLEHYNRKKNHKTISEKAWNTLKPFLIYIFFKFLIMILICFNFKHNSMIVYFQNESG